MPSVRTLATEIRLRLLTVRRAAELAASENLPGGITALAGTALVGIAFSLQAIISALAAAAGAAAVLGNSLAQPAGNAAAIPALFAIGSGAAAVKIAMTGIGDTFKFWSDQQPPTSWADADWLPQHRSSLPASEV